mgnify:CR=1 FL=1
MNQVIFFVEDDENINTLIQETLENSNFEAHGFLEPLSFLKKLSVKKPDLIVLDLMLPKMNGYEILKFLKNNRDYEDIPVIILSAKSAETDIVQGLDMGASDYITKPFGLLEFISRINVNLRKVNMHKNKILRVGELSLDITRHQFLVNDTIVELTAKEYDILYVLMESVSIVVTRGKLLKKIWGYEYLTETRTLDMHIKSLREKISKVSSETYIETVRGVGYIIKDRD